MPGPRFIRFAQRIHAYDGAVAALIRSEAAQQGSRSEAPAQPVQAAQAPPGPSGAAPGTRVVGATRAELMMSEELSGLISFGTG